MAVLSRRLRRHQHPARLWRLPVPRLAGAQAQGPARLLEAVPVHAGLLDDAVMGGMVRALRALAASAPLGEDAASQGSCVLSFNPSGISGPRR
ncbi:protein of unknown function [Aminobacter niigataensis]|nr:protein of unknown function [Aminobacter niigataensis]